jgi:hypothetical protein
VAFIGDDLTFQWGQQPQFQVHTNWLPDGADVPPFGGYQGEQATLQALQAILASGKKPIIMLMMGESFADAESPGNQHPFIMAEWAQSLEEIITTAQQAKLAVVVGTIPYSAFGDVADMNRWIFTYCNAHKIPVVNYAFALNGSIGNTAGGAAAAPGYYTPQWSGYVGMPSPLLTSAGWDLITDMAETAILQAEGYKLKSGYLQSVVTDLTDTEPPSIVNGNIVVNGGLVQFTAYGQYSDGSTHTFNNADENGRIGTWTNSNPTALFLDQTGLGTGMDNGTSDVHFTTLTGTPFSEWIMYTVVSAGQSGATY